jgi:heme-degrading monooxygenase HmoA
MIISITSSRYSGAEAHQAEAFLKSFLPKMRRFPGVIAIYHYARPDLGDESTIIIWESDEALKHYRESDLVKEAIAFEKKSKLPTTREAYPLLAAL